MNDPTITIMALMAIAISALSIVVVAQRTEIHDLYTERSYYEACEVAK